MNKKKLYKAIWLKNPDENVKSANAVYRARNPEFEQFDMPKSFWFKIYNYRKQIHFAIIVKKDKFIIYFIDKYGMAFDKIEYNTYKKAKRELRKHKFFFLTTTKNAPPLF